MLDLNKNARQVINQCLNELPEERLNFVAELLIYLVDDENATQELLNVPGFIESFERGKADIAAKRFANWRTIRHDI